MGNESKGESCEVVNMVSSRLEPGRVPLSVIKESKVETDVKGRLRKGCRRAVNEERCPRVMLERSRVFATFRDADEISVPTSST
jgi:hypothetical protein